MNEKIVKGVETQFCRGRTSMFFTTITCYNGEVVASADLRPEQVLEMRDWFDERVRELIFQGHLKNNHMGD